MGKLCERPLSPPVSRLVEAVYCKAYRVDMADAQRELGPYGSFDAFFTRKLRDGARTIDEDPVVSPADGRLAAVGAIDAGSRLLVKGRPYEVGELVGDAGEAARYSGGQFGVVYLAPSDYHRVHAPVDGKLSLVRGIPGDLYPVNAIGERHVSQLFVRNNRVAIVIDTEKLGRVTAVMVGAVIVGRISVSVIDEPAVPPGVHTIDPAKDVRRGEEIGVFHLGSTVVVLFEPGVTLSRSLGTVRYGESLLKGS